MFTSTTQSLRTASRVSQLTRQFTTTSKRAYDGTQFTLNTGAKIPALGFGTWQDKDAQYSAVTHALKAGYRHIDTARVYGTERAVGTAIQKSGIPRADIFLTTRLWNNSHHPDDVEQALDASLADLGTSYVDLYLMHWPSPFARGADLFPKDAAGKTQRGTTDYVDTYKAMEACLASGKARAIGVSNFSRAELSRLLACTSTVPAAHQLECHPYLAQRGFAAWHAAHGIHVTQYSPFGNQNAVYAAGRGMRKLMDERVLVETGARYGKSGAQVALAWGLAGGRSVVPKSKTEGRIEHNFGGDFVLDSEDVDRIEGLDRGLRFNDPSESFGWEFFADLEGKK
ncbi:Aldo/keto reductase [Lizonia empirigonia]|nr:Aldo/keto reductase [Lizonia empirigonia]